MDNKLPEYAYIAVGASTESVDPGEPAVMALIMESNDKRGCITPEEVIPSDWGTKFSRHFIPVEVDPAGFDVDEFVPTHLAMLEGEQKLEPGAMPIYFGSEKVEGHFVLLLFNEPQQKFCMFHCETCAGGFLRYMMGMQKTWKQEHDVAAGTAGIILPFPKTRN